MTSICAYLRSKQNGNRKRNNYSCWNAAFLNRLGITHELKGHNGCVNCLEWSKDGSKLISGSDDLTVRIWTPLNHPVNTIPKQPIEKHVKFITPHRMNIFDLKFMKEERQIISCAADCAICLIDIETESAQQLWKAGGRMKKLTTHDDWVFTAACEDGKVYLFDLRTRNRPESEIVDQEALEHDIQPKCLDYSKRKMTLAVGYTSSVVRVFDLRQTSKTMKKYSPGALVFNNASSGSYMQYHVTDVRFNDSGNELLVNVGNDHIYLFDMKNDLHTKMSLPDIEPTDENNPDLPVPFSAQAEKFKNEGNAAFREETYWVAEQLYSDALFASPNNPVLLSNSAAALARRNYRGDHYHCFRLAQRALQTTPSYKKCRLKGIKAMEKMKLWENVKEEYEKLLEFEPELSTKREIEKYKKRNCNG